MRTPDNLHFYLFFNVFFYVKKIKIIFFSSILFLLKKKSALHLFTCELFVIVFIFIFPEVTRANWVSPAFAFFGLYGSCFLHKVLFV